MIDPTPSVRTEVPHQRQPPLRNRGWKERYPRPMMGIESCGMLISAVHHEEGEEKLHLLMLDNHIPAGAKMY